MMVVLTPPGSLNSQLQATMDSFDLFVDDLNTHLLPNFGGGSYASETTVAMFKSDDGLNWTTTYLEMVSALVSLGLIPNLKDT